mgnify:CR=1 FL=1
MRKGEGQFVPDEHVHAHNQSALWVVQPVGFLHADGSRKRTQQYVAWATDEATWEPAENISDDLLAEYEAGLDAEAELEAAKASATSGDQISRWLRKPFSSHSSSSAVSLTMP